MPDEYISREKTLALLKSLGSRDYRREKGTIQDTIKMISSAAYTPAADVAPVVHGTLVTEVRTRTIVGYHEEIGVLAGDRSTLYRRNMVQADIPYDHCPICGATLCSRWHNFCGKCGARMDGAAE